MLCAAGWCAAGEPLPPASADGLFAFANRLRDEGDYARAITEYRRLLFHFPKSRNAAAARLELAGCYARAGRWDQARQEYEAAAAAYDEYARAHPKTREADEARWRRAWSFLLAHRFELAERAFQAIEPPSRHAEPARALAEESRRLTRRRRKSPLLAGILGIVPGLGHFYSGRYMDGLTAVAVDGFLGWGAASAFKHGAKVAGAALGLFGVNFYAGSIFGAVNWAHRTNRARAQRRIDELRRRYGM